MTRLRLALSALAALAAALLAAPAAAVPLKKLPPALNPAKAYVLVEYKLQKNPFANWPGSRKTMPLSTGLFLARYDRAAGDLRGLGRAAGNPVPPKQAARELFRNDPLVKGDGARLFLLELDPDTWVIEGFGGTAFSLGSRTFDLAPGTVTDLGVVLPEPDWAEGQEPPEAGEIFYSMLSGPFGHKVDMAPFRLTFRPRGAGDLPIPAALPADRIRAAEFTPEAKFGNRLGGLVNRIDGVNARLKAKAAP